MCVYDGIKKEFCQDSKERKEMKSMKKRNCLEIAKMNGFFFVECIIKIH